MFEHYRQSVQYVYRIGACVRVLLFGFIFGVNNMFIVLALIFSFISYMYMCCTMVGFNNTNVGSQYWAYLASVYVCLVNVNIFDIYLFHWLAHNGTHTHMSFLVVKLFNVIRCVTYCTMRRGQMLPKNCMQFFIELSFCIVNRWCRHQIDEVMGLITWSSFLHYCSFVSHAYMCCTIRVLNLLKHIDTRTCASLWERFWGCLMKQCVSCISRFCWDRCCYNHCV